MTFPKNNTVDPIYLPVTPPAKRLHDIFVAQLSSIIDAPASVYGDSCGKCLAGLQGKLYRLNLIAPTKTIYIVGQTIALTRPELVIDIMLELCNKYKFSVRRICLTIPYHAPKMRTIQTKCYDSYSGTSYGGVITQVLANAGVGGYDGQVKYAFSRDTLSLIWSQSICNNFVASSCPLPPPVPLNLTSWFKSPKPANAVAPLSVPGRQRLKVLHISDFHLDPREFSFDPGGKFSKSVTGYMVSAESNCTGAPSLCCRDGVFNPTSPGKILAPAPRYGAFQWCALWDHQSLTSHLTLCL